MQESDWDETVVFDRQHLKAFTSGDPFFEKQILDIFIDNAPEYLAALYQTPLDNWSAIAHKLKGAARSIGAWRLARASERAEHEDINLLTDAGKLELCSILNTRMEELLLHINSLPKDEDGLLL